MRSVELTGYRAWKEWKRSGQQLDYIPANPDQTYSEWAGLLPNLQALYAGSRSPQHQMPYKRRKGMTEKQIEKQIANTQAEIETACMGAGYTGQLVSDDKYADETAEVNLGVRKNRRQSDSRK
jgi:hypothetical protein